MSGSDPNLEPIELTEEFLRSLPKTDLHVHLDGSLRLETMLELHPDFTPAKLDRYMFADEADRERIIADLRTAGLQT